MGHIYSVFHHTHCFEDRHILEHKRFSEGKMGLDYCMLGGILVGDHTLCTLVHLQYIFALHGQILCIVHKLDVNFTIHIAVAYCVLIHMFLCKMQNQ